MRDGDLGAGLCGGIAFAIVFIAVALFLACIRWACRALWQRMWPCQSCETTEPPNDESTQTT
jgi:hypothetical protein